MHACVHTVLYIYSTLAVYICVNVFFVQNVSVFASVTTFDVFSISVCACEFVYVCVCAWPPSSSVAFHAVHELYKSIS